jgi:hypothetical protein
LSSTVFAIGLKSIAGPFFVSFLGKQKEKRTPGMGALSRRSQYLIVAHKTSEAQ